MRWDPTRADERQKLETLCRYISRPAVSEQRLSLTAIGNVRDTLKTPYREGTAHVIFEPWTVSPGSPPGSPSHGSIARGSTVSSPPIASTERK